MKQRMKLMISVVAALVIVACGGGGSISGGADNPDEAADGSMTNPTANSPAGDPAAGTLSITTTEELATRLITRFASADDFDAWLCDNADNQRFLYGFNDLGGVREGVETVVSEDASQSFEWTVVSTTEVRLDYPEVDSQVDLTNIQFSTDKAFTAKSSQRGTLGCTLETVLENNSVGTANADASADSDVVALTEKIATSWTSDSAFDIWLCSTESGGVGYVFTLAGAIGELQAAIESSTQAGDTVTLSSIWRATDGSTLELSHEDGAVVTIESIHFDNSKTFDGNNSKFGRMACKLDSFAAE
ncbi:MAG: hypothetical protein V3U76_04520 [Granulosicoccus sp.]